MQMLDTTKDFKTSIGSPAYLNMKDLPRPNKQAVELKLDLDDIQSHKGKALDTRKLLDHHSEEHPLTKHFEETGWNNIPLPLKELLAVIV